MTSDELRTLLRPLLARRLTPAERRILAGELRALAEEQERLAEADRNVGHIVGAQQKMPRRARADDRRARAGASFAGKNLQAAADRCISRRRSGAIWASPYVLMCSGWGMRYGYAPAGQSRAGRSCIRPARAVGCHAWPSATNRQRRSGFSRADGMRRSAMGRSSPQCRNTKAPKEQGLELS